MKHSAYIALGSNIEPRRDYLTQAIQLLNEHSKIEVTQESAVYDTVPKGYTEQENFLNMVVEVQTSLAPIALLDACQEIEQKLHRVREIKYGPRTIDLDIILYDEVMIETERLAVPHPRMHERAFVLFPLEEIAKNTRVGRRKVTVAELKEALPPEEKTDVRRLGTLHS